MNFSWIAGILFVCGTQRMPESKLSSMFWFSLLEWVRSAHSTRLEDVSVSRKRDQIIRICSINHVIWSESDERPWRFMRDDVAKSFLAEQCQASQYMNVSMRDLR